MIDREKAVFGGNFNRNALKIAPTVIDGVNYNNPLMKEEIFGPLLPIISYSDFDQMISLLQKTTHPLALYIFSENRTDTEKAISRLNFGGGCINDTVIHLANSRLPFGGIGESGMGSYHGERGFATFSHCKSIVDKKTWIDLPWRYRPYSRNKDRIIRRFMK